MLSFDNIAFHYSLRKLRTTFGALPAGQMVIDTHWTKLVKLNYNPDYSHSGVPKRKGLKGNNFLFSQNQSSCSLFSRKSLALTSAIKKQGEHFQQDCKELPTGLHHVLFFNRIGLEQRRRNSCDATSHSDVGVGHSRSQSSRENIFTWKHRNHES